VTSSDLEDAFEKIGIVANRDELFLFFRRYDKDQVLFNLDFKIRPFNRFILNLGWIIKIFRFLLNCVTFKSRVLKIIERKKTIIFK
jgi:hypothetical protein